MDSVAGFTDEIKVKLVVDTTELDEALEKERELEKLKQSRE